MTYPTAEVRWFWPGEVPKPVLDWLSGWPVPPEVQPARVDHYARLPAGMRDTVGIKLRAGRLEIKWRHRDLGLVRLAPGAFGRMEHWRKQISGPGEAGERHLAGPARDGDSVVVTKVRRLARFWVTGDDQVMPVVPPDPVSGACEFEVTAVRAMGQVWWTACFEAFGAGEAVLEATLLRVASHVLATPHPFTLSAEQSFSYPHWLARIDPAP